MFYYALTLDKIQAPGFLVHYEKFIDSFKEAYPNATLEPHYEEGKQGRLHLHAMVASPTKIYINRLKKIAPSDTYSLNFELTKSRLAWEIYISLDTHLEHALISRWRQLEAEFYEKQDNDSEHTENSISEEYIEIPEKFFSTDILSLKTKSF